MSNDGGSYDNGGNGIVRSSDGASANGVKNDIGSLIELSRNADPEVRGRVAVALGTIPSLESFSALVDMLSDVDDRVKVATIRSLGEIGNQNAVEPLLPLLEEESTEIVCATLSALAQTGNERAFAPIVVRLFDQDDDIRKNACAAIGPLRDPRSLQPLLMCLKDSNEWVRANSAWSLGMLDCAEAVEPLQAVANSNDSDLVRSNAVSALGSIGIRAVAESNPGSGTLLFVHDVLSDTAETPKVRIAAMLVFGQEFAKACSVSQDVSASSFMAVEELTGSSDDDVRSTAIWCLGKMCSRDNVRNLGISQQVVDGTYKILAEALKDQHEWCVRYAIESLQELGESRCRNAIENFADETDSDIYKSLCNMALSRFNVE